MDEIKTYLISFAILILFIFLGFLFRKIIFSKLIKWAKKTPWRFDDVIIASLKGPILLWFILIGFYFSTQALNLPSNWTTIISKILLSLGIISVTFVIANVGFKLINVYGAKIESTLPLTGLTQNLAKLIIYILGFLILLNTLGITITPILTTLGLGGLAVALALQDTLSNFFAGIHIILTRQIKIGNYIKLSSGEEGYVVDVTWRSTKIRMLPNNIVLIPNAKLAQAIVTNYYLPQKEMAVLVQVGVHYDSDLEKVEKITIEVGEEVMKEVKGGVPEFKPFIRYHTFGNSSINFTVILRAKEFVDQYLVKHEFIKRLHKRYNKEGIVIPFPITALNFEQEKKK
jgi:small-conductance mechanosensitive channel